MRIISYREVEAKEVEEGSRIKIRWLNTEGSSNFAVRHIEIETSGYSPYHSHPWEHEMFVLEGNGTALGNKEAEAISVGDLISIPAYGTQNYRLWGRERLRRYDQLLNKLTQVSRVTTRQLYTDD